MLAAVVVLLGIRLLSPAVGTAGLPNVVQDFLTLAISVVVESLPFVVLGIVLSIVVEVWVPVGALENVLPQNAFGRRAVISLIGMLFPVCECGNVPLARGLMMRGFTPAEAVTFLVAAPILNPLVIISTAQAFGWSGWILPVRIVGGFVVANLVGWIVARAWRSPSRVVPTGLLVWGVTLVVGMVLRALSGEGVVIPFVITTAIILALLMLGWRAISALVVRRRARA